MTEPLSPDLWGGLSLGFLPRLPESGAGGRRGRAASPIRRLVPAGVGAAPDLESFYAEVLGSIPRSDQRRWGALYVRGLLSTPGRKTIARIAQTLATPPADQSLQQFVNQSPWDWEPVRRDLAAVAERVVAPQAWVVRPVSFPRSGEKSVGVARQFAPDLAKLLNCQIAMSVWLAAPEASCPVDWRLILPAAWAEDARRRTRAGIPVRMRAERPWEGAVRLVLDLAQRLELSPQPLVLDLRHGRPDAAVAALRQRQLRFIARLDATAPMALVTRAGMGGLSALPVGPEPVANLLAASQCRTETVPWVAPDQRRRVCTMAAVRVRLAGSSGGRSLAEHRIERPLLLLAERVSSEAPPTSYWVTNMTTTPVPELTRLLKLTERVAVDQENLVRNHGLTDFEGRSYRGWHHHVTLASIAQAANLTHQQSQPTRLTG